MAKDDKRPKECPNCGAKIHRFRRKIRGLLCHSCNAAIGLLKDNLDDIILFVQNYKKVFKIGRF